MADPESSHFLVVRPHLTGIANEAVVVWMESMAFDLVNSNINIIRSSTFYVPTRLRVRSSRLEALRLLIWLVGSQNSF
jgi:hypothetical protein